jgi:hypothetical protein
MEIILIILVIGGLWYAYKITTETKKDADLSDAAPYKVEPNITTKPDGIGHESVPVQPTISNVLDVNGDGKVNIEDAKEVVKKTKAKAKKVADEVVTEVKTVAKKTTAKVKAVPAKKAKKPAK